jgi:hypothetical protein
MTKNVPEAIARLWSTNSAERQSGANELFLGGRGIAEEAIADWLADAELAALLGAPDLVITVGIAVGQDTFLKIRSMNGEPRMARVPPDQDAQEFELHFPGKVRLDVLTTRDAGGDGAIARYLAKFNQGIQQVEVHCRNVDRATEVLKEKFGVAAVYPATRPGANGSRVNFFLVNSPKGTKVLIELYETPQHSNPGKSSHH